MACSYMVCEDEPGDEDSESDASSFPMSEEDEKATTKQAEPKKGQRGRKRRTEPIVVTKEDGTREEVSPQVYRRLRRCLRPPPCDRACTYTSMHTSVVRLYTVHASMLAAYPGMLLSLVMMLCLQGRMMLASAQLSAVQLWSLCNSSAFVSPHIWCCAGESQTASLHAACARSEPKRGKQLHRR